MANKGKTRRRLNPYLIVLLSFIGVILVGSLLLSMPFTHMDGVNTGNYIDHLFTAVSATCVTGACTYESGFANSINFWGQLVTVIMIQIGGLGFITFLTFFITLFDSRLQFKDRFALSQMVGSDSTAGVVKFIRKIIAVTFIFEASGFLLYLPVFLKMYSSNIPQALWNCLFHSISAYCNAGFDLFAGTSSLIGSLSGIKGEEVTGFLYIYFVIVTMILIVAGGLSFLVVLDLVAVKRIKRLKVFSKIAIVSSISLLILGSVAIYLTDGNYKDPNGMTFFQAMFQSVTCRTAGFATYLQDDISWGGKLISSLLMFIGGTPLGTAGGIKTTTVFMVLLSIGSLIKGKGNDIHAFKRKFSTKMALKAILLLVIALFVCLIGFILVYSFEKDVLYESVTSSISMKTSVPLAVIYEIFSCFGTTGFFTNIEPYITTGSKIVLCLLMLIGRLGPITFFSIFESSMRADSRSHFTYVEEDFLIG